MERVIDARGMACPMPVIETKKAMEEIGEGSLITIVDNEPAKENVVAFAKSRGCEASVDRNEDGFHISIVKKAACTNNGCQITDNTVVLVASSELGRGSSELGNIVGNVTNMYTIYEKMTKADKTISL